MMTAKAAHRPILMTSNDAYVIAVSVMRRTPSTSLFSSRPESSPDCGGGACAHYLYHYIFLFLIETHARSSKLAHALLLFRARTAESPTPPPGTPTTPPSTATPEPSTAAATGAPSAAAAGIGSARRGVVEADGATEDVHAIALLDAFCRLLDRRKLDVAEALHRASLAISGNSDVNNIARNREDLRNRLVGRLRKQIKKGKK